MITQWDIKKLRSRFLDDHMRSANRQMLNVVAHMIIQIDRDDDIIDIGLEYLASELSVGRVDIGFGSSCSTTYTACSEYLLDGAKSILGINLPNKNSILQRVWSNQAPVVYDNIKQNQKIDDHIKSDLIALDTRAMLAQRLGNRKSSFGIICIDDLETDRVWNNREEKFVSEFCNKFFAPIISISKEINTVQNKNKPSPAELDAIRLAAQGLSYKRIAAQLNKSIRTVEFQLRNARAKTGATNQAELVKICQYWL